MTMPNHPNRNWRTRMHAECAGWLGRWNLPADGVRLLFQSALSELLQKAYIDGYSDGRLSLQRPKKEG